jgi:type I restriction enzyme S subunit
MMSLDFVKLEDVALIEDESRLTFDVGTVRLRPGPFPYYGQRNQDERIDDYTYNGDYLLLGAEGMFATADGAFLTKRVSKRFTAGEFYHVIRPRAPEDRDYLEFVLGATKVHQYIASVGFRKEISVDMLRQVRLFWPDPTTREQLVTLSRAFSEQSGALKAQQELILVLGDRYFAESFATSDAQHIELDKLCSLRKGAFLPLEERFEGAGTPVFTSKSTLQNTNRVLAKAGSLLIRSEQRQLFAEWVPVDCWPTETYLFIEPDYSFVPTAYLFFALRANHYTRAKAEDEKYKVNALSDTAKLKIPVHEEASMVEFAVLGELLLRSIYLSGEEQKLYTAIAKKAFFAIASGSITPLEAFPGIRS